MNELKHTPGPWVTDDKQSGDVFRYVMPEDGSVLPICRLDVDRFETEANARLIAAAPELLEALKEIVRNDPWGSSSAGMIARAAITKATGESA
jgi:hypothetical protein